jgi:hypothetical protein
LGCRATEEGEEEKEEEEGGGGGARGRVGGMTKTSTQI